MIERGISQEEVMRAIQCGPQYIQHPKKFVCEYGYFTVIYKKIEETYFIITVKPRDS